MNFAQELKKLNPKQRQAVTTIEGPVMVVAGPGTGKTQVLTLRIANILKTAQVEAENILAITFTESGVAAMRKRLSELIGSAAYGVRITTFHAFANGIIREHPESFPRIIGATPMTEVDQLRILETIISNSKLQTIKPFGDVFHYIKDIARAIDDLKRENVSPKEFSKIAASELKSAENNPEAYPEKGKFKGKLKAEAAKEIKHARKNKELALVYEKYQAALTKQKSYDYTDMIVEAVAALSKDRDLLFELQEHYQYVLVDEHQDTNNAQNKLLELLMSFHKDPNLFVVGDAKQAVYRFQGASLENFLYFKKLYPRAKLIELTDNYRSTQPILDAAGGLSGFGGQLTAKAGHRSKNILRVELSNGTVEHYFVARHIKERLQAGAGAHEIAVLYRDNKDALPMATMLERLSVPFTIESAQNIFDDADIKKLRTLFSAIAKFGNHEFLVLLLYADFLKIDPLDAHRVVAYATTANSKWRVANGGKKVNYLSIYDVLRSQSLLKTTGVENSAPFLQLYANLAKWHNAAQYESAATLFEAVVQESGFLGHILQKPNGVDILHKLNVFFDELKDLIEQHGTYSLEQFVKYLDMLDEHELLIKRIPPATRQQGRVKLMTAHASKGQEFDYVYIIGAVDGHWGNKRHMEKLKLPSSVYRPAPAVIASLPTGQAGTRSKPEIPRLRDDKATKDDDRNLFYVALTRARKEVVISLSKTSGSGREQLPSQFLAEIKPELIDPIDVSAYERDFAGAPVLLYSRPPVGEHRIKEKEFVRELFLQRGLSVTHLNNYLDCPWKYFFTNLIRIPEAKNKHLMYGSAVHKALQVFFESRSKQVTSKQVASEEKKLLLRAFRDALSEQPLTKDEQTETLTKGEKALAGYYDEYSKTWTKKVLSEFDIHGVHLPVSSIEGIKEVKLDGKIDKMEILPPHGFGTETMRGVAVNVVDYKTGKPKSRNVLEGKIPSARSGQAKSADGNYRRQLAFYSLLLSLYKDGKYTMKTGEIDFVESDERGKYHKEQFVIEPKEVADLKKEIERVSDEILNLKFWNSTCGQRDCKYCPLAEML